MADSNNHHTWNGQIQPGVIPPDGVQLSVKHWLVILDLLAIDEPALLQR